MTEEQKRIEELKAELERIENNASGYYDHYDVKTNTFTRLTKEEAIQRAVEKYEQAELETPENNKSNKIR